MHLSCIKNKGKGGLGFFHQALYGLPCTIRVLEYEYYDDSARRIYDWSSFLVLLSWTNRPHLIIGCLSSFRYAGNNCLPLFVRTTWVKRLLRPCKNWSWFWISNCTISTAFDHTLLYEWFNALVAYSCDWVGIFFFDVYFRWARNRA